MSGRTIDRAVRSPLSVLVGLGAGAALLTGFATQMLAGAGGAGVNLFVLAAVVGVAADLWRMGRTHDADLADLAIYGVALALVAVPIVSAGWLALGLLGACCLRRHTPTALGCGWLLVGLSVFFLKDRLWAGFVSGAILDAEAVVLHALAGAVIGSVEQTGNLLLLADGRSLLILRDCSLLSLMGPSLLGVVALRRLSAPQVRPGWRPLAIAAGIVVLGNFLRLLAMAWSPEVYHVVHDGAGRTVFGAVLTFAVVLIGIRRPR